MSIKKYSLFLILVFQYLFSYSQISESKSFTLAWNDNASIRINEEKSILLPLVEGNFFNENNIPTFTHLLNVQNNALVQEYQIKNVKFSTLARNQLSDINISAIPTELESEFQNNRNWQQFGVKLIQLAAIVLRPAN